MPRPEPYSFTIQWSINPIYFNPFKRGQPLSSPVFQVNALWGTRWRLHLYPRGTIDPNYMGLYLLRTAEGGAGLASVPVNFRMSVDNISEDLSFARSANGISFKRKDQFGFSRFVRVSMAKLLSSTSVTKTFTLRCEMSLSDDLTVDIAEDSTVDLRTLSEDFGKIRQMASFSDVVLKCGREEFNANKMVITARAPELARALNLEGDVEEVDASFMSSRVLRTLLYYIYTGDMDVPVFNIPKELMMIAEQLDLRGLLKLMHVVPNICHAKTSLNVEHKSFLWSLGEKHTSFVRIVPTPGLDISSLVLSVEVTERIQVGIKPKGLDPDSGVFVKCTIMGEENHCIFWELCSQEHLFECDGEWTLNLPFRESHMPDFNSLGIEIDVCDGVKNSRLHHESSTSYSSHSLCEICQLSSDFQAFINNPSYSDVVITCHDHVFHAHRLVLAVRSPVFEKMFHHDFLEKRTGSVKVTDFRPNVVRAMLFYMYCGKLESLEYKDIRDLYEAADKYQVTVLKKKCSAILLDHLRYEDAEELWWIADMHGDSDLKELVEEFLYSYESAFETSV